MFNRIIVSGYYRLLHIASLRAAMKRARRVPIIRSITNRLSAGVASAHGERIWRQTRIGWMKFEPVWEGLVVIGDCDIEPETRPVFDAHLHENTVFYDVGAHIGYYTLLAATRGKQVFSFEPDPENFQIVQEVVARNNLSNVSAVSAAVSDTNGHLEFVRSVGLRASGHIAGIGCDGADSNERVQVPAITLDEFCLSHPIPTFIKIDVEGAEESVLRGAANLLRNHHPVVLVEVHGEEYLPGVQNLLSDYQLTRLDRPDMPPFPSHYVGI